MCHRRRLTQTGTVARNLGDGHVAEIGLQLTVVLDGRLAVPSASSDPFARRYAKRRPTGEHNVDSPPWQLTSRYRGMRCNSGHHLIRSTACEGCSHNGPSSRNRCFLEECTQSLRIISLQLGSSSAHKRRSLADLRTHSGDRGKALRQRIDGRKRHSFHGQFAS
jgi:hypothetical protein